MFVHGAWHSGAVWRPVAAALASHGHRSVVLDLPGCGPSALNPAAYIDRSLSTLPTDPSPSSHITQRQRTDFVIDAVKAAAEHGAPVVLVAHSYGGMTATAVVEEVPHLISSVVYVSGFMLPPQWSFVRFQQEPCMAADLIKTVLLAPPPTINALRVDWRCTEPAYARRCKAAFAGDLDDATWTALYETYHCDEPLSTAVEPCQATPVRFGRVPRRYIRCLQDHAVVPSGQNWLIQHTDAAMGNATRVDDIDTAHTPMLANTRQLAQLLMKAAPR